jgi:predicted RNA-binding Zn-ribbon protein involved in translation (DUF1610 family)
VSKTAIEIGADEDGSPRCPNCGGEYLYAHVVWRAHRRIYHDGFSIHFLNEISQSDIEGDCDWQTLSCDDCGWEAELGDCDFRRKEADRECP